MAIVPNIIGMVRDINERKENARIQDVMRNNLDNPDAIFKSIYDIDPMKAQAYQDDQTARQAAATEAQDKALDTRMSRLKQAVKFLRGVPQEQLGAAFDRFAPVFGELGLGEGTIGTLREQALASPDYLDSLDDDAYKAAVEDRYTTRTLTPGAEALKDGKVVHRVPYQMKPVTVGSAQTGYTTNVFDPNTGEFVTEGASPVGAGPAQGGGLSVDMLAPHFIAQESGGDYTAKNSDTGALGAYQVMPETGRVLAQRLGLAWRPDMMTRDDPQSRRYQDAIGQAAIQEAVEASEGDPETLFSYYYGGSDRSKWGPRTRQYTQEMMQRLGGAGQGGQPQVGRRSITVPAAAPKPQKSTRTLSPEEAQARGYPAGAVVQVDSTGAEKVTYRPPSSASEKSPQEQAEAQERLGGMLAGMANDYARLSELGGIVDPRQSGLENIGSWAASSGVGQLLGGAFGTEEQSIRQQIRNSQPLLLQNIREATNMGARGLDSNKEMEFYIQAASDPKKDLPSNLSALLVLDMAYGSQDGSAVLSGLPMELREMVAEQAERTMRSRGTKFGGQGSSTAPAPPKVGEVRRGYKFLGGNPAEQSSWERVQ